MGRPSEGQVTLCPSCYNRDCPLDDRASSTCVEYVSESHANTVERQLKEEEIRKYGKPQAQEKQP